MSASAFAATGGELNIAVSVSANGDNALGVAVAGKKVRLLSLVLTAASAVTLTLKSDTGGGATALSGGMLVTTALFILPMNDAGWCDTAAGKDLNLFTGSGVALTGIAKVQIIP
jgi:hypothetical protein